MENISKKIFPTSRVGGGVIREVKNLFPLESKKKHTQKREIFFFVRVKKIKGSLEMPKNVKFVVFSDSKKVVPYLVKNVLPVYTAI